MKQLFESSILRSGAALITCSSHEDRCRALPSFWSNWRPSLVALFHYDDPNPQRENNHRWLVQEYSKDCPLLEIPFTERRPSESFWAEERHLRKLAEICRAHKPYLDISVFTKRHLLVTLQWLNDNRVFPQLLYSEPEEYDVSEHIPLSFGLSQVEEIPGFPAAPDASRPLQAILFLGYEGERALATYELLQPVQTILVVPEPAFRARWEGKSDHFNRHLIETVGRKYRHGVDGLDPEATFALLQSILGSPTDRSSFYRVLCPLGTKPQAVGAYLYARRATDPPAIIYSSPLRHNHDFFSHGIRRLWLIDIDSW